MLQRGLAEQRDALLDIGLGESFAFRRELDIAAVRLREAEHDRGFHDGQQVVELHQEIFGNPVQVFLAAAVVEQFEQSADRPGPRMRQQFAAAASLRRSAER